MLRRPVMVTALLVLLAGAWILLQGAGADSMTLASSVCNWGMVPAELTHRLKVGTAVHLGPELLCVVDEELINPFTPLTSMFLHGSWGHLLGNGIFLWVFGKAVEDSMGRLRFLAFYLLCGLAAAAVHVAVEPASPLPTVGASGAISGMLGAYLVLYPRARVRLLFILVFLIRVISLPAYVVLLWWVAYQVLAGLPQLLSEEPAVSAGVAFWAHVGGFAAGVLGIKLFEDKHRVEHRLALRRGYF